MYFGMYCDMYSVVFARIKIQYVQNTNTIHANTDWRVLNTYLLSNTYHQYIPQYIPQYMPIHWICIGMY